MNVFVFFGFAFVFLLLAVVASIEARRQWPTNTIDMFISELLWVAFIGCTCAGFFLVMTT